MGVTSIAENGVTCAGPNNFVVGFSEWLLEVSTNTAITYTQPITLHHGVAIENGLGPQTVTVSYAGTLPVQWHLYGGDWVGPDLGDPLPPTFTVTDWKDLWLISDPTPAGAPSGAHTLAFTVTTEMTPTSRWIADNLWLGPWTPPPPAPCGALANLQVSGANAAPGEALQLTATASPITATTPYSYTWRSAGQPTAMHPYRYYTDTVTYTWPDAGVYTVTVAVENCGGVRTAVQTVRVGEEEKKIFVPFAKKE
ncbi:MAG: PKD domain-containing protein [Anaerolineales bacterium]|nr:PKD domain-containing protein [Anaerolineales bacterium]